MPEDRPTAHPPGPPRRPPVVLREDDDLGDLLELDEPEDDADALDLLEDWPDDEPLDDLLEPDEPLREEELEVFVDDEPPLDALDLDDEAGLEELELDLEEPLILPWRTRARLPEHDLTLPAILDPTAERTTWFGGVPGRLRVELGEVSVRIDPFVVPAEERSLRIGRDVLSGRIVVSS